MGVILSKNLAETDLLSPREERQFTEPVIRFRRIRGRIVPIINRKRTGQITNKFGNKALIAAASLITIGSAKSVLKRQKLITLKDTSFLLGKNAKKFRFGGKAPLSKKIAFASAKVISAPVRFVLKRPFKLGIAFAGIGLAARAVGFELESRSEFGFDIGDIKSGQR